jgi:very-short-patch-repair endonuclease
MRAGGVATREELRRFLTARQVRESVLAGEIVRLRRGIYGLPDAVDAQAAFARVGGVSSHLTAALGYEWKVQFAPRKPMVVVPRNRSLTPERRAGIDVRWGDLGPDDVDGHRTSRLRTVTDCARTLPFSEALSVADSALREGRISHQQLITEAEGGPRTGRAAAVAVARAADGRAANPFESALRALCMQVPGLLVQPQLWVDHIGRADLVDVLLSLVIEAESWEFHGSEDGFARDIRRYTDMVRAGWIVVRFTWHEVMFEPERVIAVLAEVVARQQRRLAA